MERGIEGKRLGTAAALALTTTMVGGSVGAQTIETNTDQGSDSPIASNAFEPECNPFLKTEQALLANPIDPADFKTEVDQVKSGETEHRDLPYGVYKFLTEQPEEASIVFDVDSEVLDALPTPEELLVDTLGEEYCPVPNENDEEQTKILQTDQVDTSSSVNDLLPPPESSEDEIAEPESTPKPKLKNIKNITKGDLPSKNLRAAGNDLIDLIIDNKEEIKDLSLGVPLNKKLLKKQLDECINAKMDQVRIGTCSGFVLNALIIYGNTYDSEFYDKARVFAGSAINAKNSPKNMKRGINDFIDQLVEFLPEVYGIK